MKSIQIRGYGGYDVVEVKKTASVPNISSGKVLVNVKASGVNPVDWKIREGYMQPWGSIFLALSNKLGKATLLQILNKEMRYMDRLVS